MSVSSNLLALSMLGVLAAAGASAQTPTSGKAAFRWVDDKGVVHYGDRIPPEYAKRERSVLNNQGVEVAHLPAQRTPEQLAQDERNAEVQRKQYQHDTFLLSTYQSVRDVEQLRDTRLQQLTDQRRSTESYLGLLNSQLDELQARVQMFKPYSDNPKARRMPDQVADEVVRAVNQVRAQRSALDGKIAEENALRQQFQLDIDRYRKLKSGTSAAR